MKKESIFQEYVGGYALINNFPSTKKRSFEVHLVEKIKDVFSKDGLLNIVPQNGDVKVFDSQTGYWENKKFENEDFSYKYELEFSIVSSDKETGVYCLEPLKEFCIVSLHLNGTKKEEILFEVNKVINKNFMM